MKKARKERIFPFSPIFSTAPRPPPRVSPRNTPKTGGNALKHGSCPDKPQNAENVIPLTPRHTTPKNYGKTAQCRAAERAKILRADGGNAQKRHSAPTNRKTMTFFFSSRRNAPPFLSPPTAPAANENAPQSGAPCSLCRFPSLSCIFVIFRHFSPLFVTFRQISTWRLLRKFASFSLANPEMSPPYASGVRSTA